MTRMIVLATHGSRSVEKAVETASELAKATRWPLPIATVWSLPASGFGHGVVPLPELAQGELEVVPRTARKEEGGTSWPPRVRR
jgi:hypothetical protein